MQNEDTFSVMALTLIVVAAVLLASVIILWVFTNDIYLDAYYVLETFFDVQNTAAASSLALLAFVPNSGGLAYILAVVIADNLSRLLIVSFILAAVIELLEYANVEEFINEFKAHALRNHVIICGYNEMSRSLMKKLKGIGMSYLVLTSDRKESQQLNDSKVLNLFGESAEEEVLKKAGIENARAIVFTSEDSMENVMSALTARRSSGRVKIISRLGDEHVRRKVYGIGVDLAVIPEQLAGLEMGEYVLKVFGA
jgi:voltage-gated potassium channel